MAKIGLKNFRYSVLTEASDGTPSYAGATTPAKAVSCSVSISNNEAELYADDGLAESDYSFNKGDVTIGVDKEDQATMAALLGHSVDSTTQAMTRNATDTAPFVGFGRVVTLIVGGSYKYKVEFLYKVKFAEPSQEDQTKGESVAFNTYTIPGKVHQLGNGNWSITKTFDSESDALSYLEGLLAAPTPPQTETQNPVG